QAIHPRSSEARRKRIEPSGDARHFGEPVKQLRRQGGFSLLELMTAAAIFIVLCGAAFGLLTVCQKSYQTESQVLNSFQEARLGVDQMVRDVNISGYPSQTQFAETPTAEKYAQTPVAWIPGYVSGAAGAPCTVGGSCTSPGDFDLIVETNIDP